MDHTTSREAELVAWADELGRQIADHASTHDRDGTFVAEAYDPLRASGYLALAVPEALGGGSPDSAAIRTARANVKQHMRYTNWLAGTRPWLAGPRLTYADLAAAATLSILDYLGEIDWSDPAAARDWYARVKSRPSFRPLLADRVRGITPASHYADLDF